MTDSSVIKSKRKVDKRRNKTYLSKLYDNSNRVLLNEEFDKDDVDRHQDNRDVMNRWYDEHTVIPKPM